MKILKRKGGLIAFYLLLCVFIIVSEPILAQTTPSKRIPLSDALKQITAHFKVNFLYEEIHIGNKKINFNADSVKTQKIGSVLTAVLTQVELRWSKIDEKNYSIFPADRSHTVNDRAGKTVEMQSTADTVSLSGLLPLPALSETTQMLKQVNIRATRPVLQKKGDRYVLSIDKSILAEGSSILEMMVQLPGVQLKADGQLSVNGRSAVSILIDGKPTTLSGADLNLLLQGMLAASVEKIELLTSPSAKYEAAGSGGTINIVRKSNRQDGLNGNAGIGYGRGVYNRYNSSFNIGFKHKRYNLFLNNSIMMEKTELNANANSEFFKGPNRTGAYQAENFHIRDSRTFLPVLGLELFLSKKTTLAFSGSAQIQSFKSRSNSFTDILDQDLVQTDRLRFLNNSNDPTRNYSTTVHLGRQIDSSGRELTVDLDYSNYHNASSQDIQNKGGSSPDGFPGISKVFLDQQNHLNIYSAKADYTHPLKKRAKLEMGVKVSEVQSKSYSDFYDGGETSGNLDLSKSNYFKYSENINAAYLNYSKEAGRFSYQFGVRAEQTNGRGEQLLTNQVFRQNYVQLFPSLYLKYPLNGSNVLSFTASRKIDRPAYLDLNPLLKFVNSTAYIQGDPNLKPQLVYNNELGYAYKNIFFLTMGAGFYSSYMTYWVFPEIAAKNGAQETIVSRPVNIDHASSYNINAVYIKQLNSWWAINNNLTLYYNLYNGVVNGYVIRNQGIPSFLFSTNHTFSITDRISAEASFRYAHKSQIGSSVYQPNSNLGLGIKTMLLSNKASLSLNVTDLFRDQNFKWRSDTGQILESRDVRLDSRVVKLNFTYRFGSTGGKRTIIRSGAEEEKNRAKTN